MHGNVYHFTSLEALYSILNRYDKDNNVFYLWASQVYFQNDFSEMKYGFPITFNAIKKYEETKSIREKYRISRIFDDFKKSQEFKDWTKEFMYQHIYNNEKTPYTISFSKLGDDEGNVFGNELPLWVQYGNRGNGVALVFKESELKSPASDIFAMDVMYMDCDNSNNITLQALNNSLPEICKNSYTTMEQCQSIDEIIGEKITTLGSLCPLVSAFIKDNVFHYEHEYRVVHFCQDVNDIYKDVKFRISKKHNIIPYVEIPIPCDSLKEIILGPCYNRSTCQSVIALLDSKGLNSIDVSISAIPYREI